MDSFVFSLSILFSRIVKISDSDTHSLNVTYINNRTHSHFFLFVRFLLAIFTVTISIHHQKFPSFHFSSSEANISRTHCAGALDHIECKTRKRVHEKINGLDLYFKFFIIIVFFFFIVRATEMLSTCCIRLHPFLIFSIIY